MRFPLRLLPRVVSGHFPNFLSLFCLLQTVANAKRWSPLWRHIWAKTTAMVSQRTQPFAGGLGALQSQPQSWGQRVYLRGLSVAQRQTVKCLAFLGKLSKTEVDYPGRTVLWIRAQICLQGHTCLRERGHSARPAHLPHSLPTVSWRMGGWSMGWMIWGPEAQELRPARISFYF